MPLSMVSPGCQGCIRKVLGKAETRQYLQSLGFVPGEAVSVLCLNADNLIVGIKNSRVALSRDMAMKIMV